MKSYSNDLRRRIVAAYETGDDSQDEIAELFGVCQKTVSNFVTRYEQTGSADQLARGGGRKASLNEPSCDFIRREVEQDNDITLAQLCQKVEAQFKTKLSQSVMYRLLGALELPRKNSRSTPVSASRVPHKDHRDCPAAL
jgi:transposase